VAERQQGDDIDALPNVQRDLLSMLKGCVTCLENHAPSLNSDERRQMRRAWVLIAKVEEHNVASR
jgi:hypothetical protein